MMLNLDKLINGDCDERHDRQSLEFLNHEADRDLIRHSVPGSVVIFLLLLISSLVSDIGTVSAYFYYTVLTFSAFEVILHTYFLFLYHHRPSADSSRYRLGHGLLSLFTAICWGIFTGWSLMIYGVKIPTLVYLLFTAGIASGAASALFIRKRLAQLYLVILLVPPIAVLIAYEDSAMAFGLGLGFALYFAFLFFQVFRSNKDYWQALINTRELQLQALELEKAGNAKSEFLSHMSHELRTPLNAILGFGQLIEMGAGETKSKEYALEIINAAEHLLDMIKEILDLSRIESGRLELSLNDYSLNRILEESLKLILTLAEQRSLVINDRITTKTDFYIHADLTRFKQVLINLLSNAVKYNSEKGTITLSVKRIGRNLLRVEISDTGQGISTEQQKTLFSPFVRLPHHKGIEGTGIGLSISKRIIEMMGGEMGVESNVGTGSTFWVNIPLGVNNSHRPMMKKISE